jgi:hypothetical protein
MAIELPMPAVRDYLAAFDLAAVFITAPKDKTPVGISTGTEPPADAEACWWTEGIEAAEAVVEMTVGCDLRSAPREGDLVAVTVGTVTAATWGPPTSRCNWLSVDSREPNQRLDSLATLLRGGIVPLAAVLVPLIERPQCGKCDAFQLEGRTAGTRLPSP